MDVLKPFTCKVTKKRYEVGQTYEGARGAELAQNGFVTPPQEKVTKDSKKPEKNAQAGPHGATN